ncbi:MAG TPA: heavy metal-binding domain-containing protein [Acidimicrobiales bacterium]|nr:heavy metal-binding domain-containing protein [Acidimicrobiales bacterium]
MTDQPEAAAEALAALTAHRRKVPWHQPGQDEREVRSTVSTLSGDEDLALSAVGYHPVGAVVGASVSAIPLVGRYAYYKQNVEVEVFTYGLRRARSAAIRRLRDAARELGAHGVVGVHVDISNIPKRGDEVRVSASGTAVRAGKDPVIRPMNSPRHPFTASVTGQEFSLLARAGYRPRQIVIGVCVFHIGRRSALRTVTSIAGNGELDVITNALYQSRELAMTRMQDEAEPLGADGVIGVRIDQKTHAWGSRVIEFLAVGTAVELAVDNYRSVAPQLVVPLRDRSQSFRATGGR